MYIHCTIFMMPACPIFGGFTVNINHCYILKPDISNEVRVM